MKRVVEVEFLVRCGALDVQGAVVLPDHSHAHSHGSTANREEHSEPIFGAALSENNVNI